MAISPNQRQRLAYIRYLHQLGIDQAKQPDPFASAAVLVLHDAVESFLLLVAEHFGVASREFEKYWKEFEPHLSGGIGFPEKASMARLNRTRVALKHHGSQPNKQTIDQAVVDVATFFSASTQLVFGVDYGAVSMVSMIAHDLPRQLAEEAEATVSGGDIITGMMRLREAFEQLFAPHQPVYGRRMPTGLSFGPAPDPFFNRNLRLLGIETEIKQLNEAVQALQIGLRMAALGLSYSEYLRFDQLTPQYLRYASDNLLHWSAPPGYAPDQDAFDFCMQFVVTASLRLAEAETHAADPPWVTRDEWGYVERKPFRKEPPIENRAAATSDEASP